MITVKNLTKSFGDFSALKNFSMNVEKGSIYGLVGVNGSGKTTVIKHLAGVFRADAGEVCVAGEDVYDNLNIKARMGYVPDDLYFFPQYTLKSLGKFYAKIYKSWSNERFSELVALLELDINRRVGRFSKGMQKQAALALALATTPDFMLLDEPIDGLDPIVRKRIFDRIIVDTAERQMTVLISSHNLKEMDGICDTVGIIKGGEMLIERELDTLKDEMKNKFEHTPPSLDEIFIHLYEETQMNRNEIGGEKND
ncbi:MAG: ABC transporter ATP-binding protein [Defluviitaleaceae bacterium]|nr:ABC transporter ATP-binding protein [Defluviitaleaceae bacterium]